MPMRAKPISIRDKTGIILPPYRIYKHFKKCVKYRITQNAVIYSAAVLEYLMAETLELSGNTSLNLNVKRITPRHLVVAIRRDDELNSFIKATLSGGGVVPHIHKSLLNKK